MTELILVKVMPSVLVAAMLSPVLDYPTSVVAPLLDVHNWVATTEWADWSLNDMDGTDNESIMTKLPMTMWIQTSAMTMWIQTMAKWVCKVDE